MRPQRGSRQTSSIGANVSVMAARLGFLDRRLRRALPQIRIERAGLRDRQRKDRAVAVQHVEPEDQRNFEPAFDGHLLQPVQPFGAVDVEQAADPARRDLALHLRLAHRRRAGVDHVELAELLLKRHRREQPLDPVRIGHVRLPRFRGQPPLYPERSKFARSARYSAGTSQPQRRCQRRTM